MIQSQAEKYPGPVGGMTKFPGRGKTVTGGLVAQNGLADAPAGEPSTPDGGAGSTVAGGVGVAVAGAVAAGSGLNELWPKLASDTKKKRPAASPARARPSAQRH